MTSISYGGGNKRSLGYNDLHQLETDEVKTSAEASIGKIAYEWDRNDNLTKKTTTGFNGASTNTYSYDFARPDDRLGQRGHPGGLRLRQGSATGCRRAPRRSPTTSATSW
nr:hypothetical protein GCM10020092_010100 [Actinoplanes digitatis]